MMSTPAFERRRWTWPDWPTGLYEDAAGHHFDGEDLDRETVDRCLRALAQYRAAPAMLSDLAADGTVDLLRDDMAGVVAAAWSCTAIPESALGRARWVELFRANGFCARGRRSDLPATAVRLFRGCVPQWLHYDRAGRVVEVDTHGLPADPYGEVVESSDTRVGMAWTTRAAMARRFIDVAQHAYAIAGGQVFAATIAPEHLLAVAEGAVIVDPAGIGIDTLEPVADEATR